MQLRLPIFPKGTKMISDCLGVYEKDNIVQYIANGLPIFVHPKEDLNAFRYITSNFIEMGLCRKVDIARCFHISEDFVFKAHKKFKEQGEDGFFGKDGCRGYAHKIVGEKKDRIQQKLDKGQSVNSIAKEEGLRESAIRYQIHQGNLKKKAVASPSATTAEASTLNERNEQDAIAPMGIATTRYEERIAAAQGISGQAPVKFESHEAVVNAGVLFLLPALLSQGHLKTKEVYQIPGSHYYGLESIMLTLAFMALARIKNPEQLKQCKPGEIGRIIGLDRTPEVKCLRGKIKLLAAQKQAQELNRRLINDWYKDQPEEGAFLYVDGHQRIYYGSKAHLPAKYISRQKLCLAATTEYWVHDAVGQPVLMVIGELTEKLEQAIEKQIIPELQKTVLLAEGDNENEKQADPQQTHPACTLIFDWEGYHPSFFKKLWDKYRIAIITYRKNVPDKWANEDFKYMDVTVLEQPVIMNICEKDVELDGIPFREIRRKKEGVIKPALSVIIIL